MKITNCVVNYITHHIYPTAYKNMDIFNSHIYYRQKEYLIL